MGTEEHTQGAGPRQSRGPGTGLSSPTYGESRGREPAKEEEEEGVTHQGPEKERGSEEHRGPLH